MEITVAKNAGFCFGVKRATDSLEERIRKSKSGERIFTLGTLIHNGTYNAMLEQKGVRVTSIDEIDGIAKSATADSPVTVFIRAHGIPLERSLTTITSGSEHCSFIQAISNTGEKR